MNDFENRSETAWNGRNGDSWPETWVNTGGLGQISGTLLGVAAAKRPYAVVIGPFSALVRPLVKQAIYWE